MAQPLRCKVLRAYTAQNDGELSLDIGDVVFVPNMASVGDMVNGVSKGKVGLFPRSIVEDTTIRHTEGGMTRVKAIAPYESTAKGELSFPLGARMFVVSKLDDKWWQGIYNNESGKIPASHIADAVAEVEGKVKTLDIDPNAPSAPSTPSAPTPVAAATPQAQAQVPVAVQPPKPSGPQPWDWGKVPRLRAERELTGYPDGTFLVRASETENDTFTISVVRRGAIAHVRIKHLPGGFGVNDDDQPSETIEGLIEDKKRQIVQSNMQGRGGDVVEGKLIKTALPRPAWAPAPATMNARSSVRKTVKTRQPSVKPPAKTTGSLLAMAQGRSAPPPPKVVKKKKTVDWVVSDAELTTFNGFFKGADTDNDGLVTGPQVMKIFMSSQLPKGELAAVWTLCDIKKSGQLNAEQFALAMHIIGEKVKGVEIPSVMTPIMMPPSMRSSEGAAPDTEPTPAPSAPATSSAPAPVAAPDVPATPAAPAVVVPDQRAVYDALWDGARAGGDTLGPGQAVSFFKASGFDNSVLGGIWTIADANEPKGSLIKEEFDVALKLIALKQAGVEPTMDNIMQPAPLPSLGEHSAKAAASAAPPVVAAPVIPEPEPEPAPAPPAVMSFLDVMAAAWERIKAGVDGAGTVDGGTCAPILMLSSLEQAELGKIWGMVDSPPTGRIDYKQFGQILGLIAQGQRKEPYDIASIGPNTAAPALTGLN